MDRLLDEARSGPFYLRHPAIADMVVEAIHYNATHLEHYVLHAFVVMPNHVHLLATPALALPKLTKSLKGITSKRANTILAMTGSCFWQEESYDHLVRNVREFEKIPELYQSYIEENPVRAGLVREANEYRWSSAGWVTRGSAPPPPVGRKYRVRSDSLDWPTLTRIVTFTLYTHGCGAMAAIRLLTRAACERTRRPQSSPSGRMPSHSLVNFTTTEIRRFRALSGLSSSNSFWSA
jgi:REP element-mobilizing transposase RayT